MWQISIGQVHFAITSGSLIPLLVMVPNFVWMAFPPTSAPVVLDAEPIWLRAIENIGRMAVLLLPFFFVLDFDRSYFLPVIIAMTGSLVLYYARWVRYFLGSRSFALLKAPFFGVPVPMAAFPVVFPLLSSYLMKSLWMFVSAAIFGIAHLWISVIGL
ncbi:MAG: hypothetical protein ACOCYU_00935 [Brevefilum sp.]